MQHCACNFVPGLARFGEMHDIAGLVAPRPMLVESGTRDPLFPVAAARRGLALARSGPWAAFGAQDQLEEDLFEGRHRINGEAAYAFLARKLGAGGGAGPESRPGTELRP
jgi:hypothetical protein